MPYFIPYLAFSLLLCTQHVALSGNAVGTKQCTKTLLKAFKECEKIKSGHYDGTISYKLPFREAIGASKGHCTFNKVPADKVFGARVALAIAHKDGTVTRQLYDGRYEVKLRAGQQGEAWVYDMQQPIRSSHLAASLSSQLLLFRPLLPIKFFSKKGKKYFQHILQKRAEHIRQLPDESVAGRLCSVFEVHCKDRPEVKDEVITLFIDQARHIPIKYMHKRISWGSPTYTEAAMSNFTFSHQEDPSCVPDALAEIPEGYAIVNDHERERPQRKLLSVDNVAPAWTLPTVQEDDTLSLAALRGKVVLLSFWYKSFSPCLQYLQALQKLQDKFQAQGLVVVGVNIYDKGEKLTEFLQQRGITYPNVLDNARQVAGQYVAHTPNTFYLLDRAGKVRYATIEQENFPQKVLSKKIEQLLKKPQ